MNTSTLVAAICNACGGKLIVDTEKNVATCPYCGSTFLIATYAQNCCKPTVNSASTDSGGVLKAGEEAENKNKAEQADDVNCRIKLAPAWFSTEDTLELSGGNLVVWAGNKISRVFNLYKIYDLDISGSQMTFSYLPEGMRYSFDLDKEELADQRLSDKSFVRMIEGQIDSFP